MVGYKVVYVCVSNESDNYTEQLLLSLVSLRKKIQDIKTILLTDNLTSKYLESGLGKECKKYLDEIKVVDFLDDVNKYTRSRYLKTSMRKYVDGDFIFIDTDTIIRKNFLIDTRLEMAAVKDCHADVLEYTGQLEERKKAEQLGYDCSSQYYMNSGVIYCKDTLRTRKFFDEWHQLYIKLEEYGIVSDQISFNIINYQFNYLIKEIDGRYNCQVRFGSKYLANCFIFHYGGSGSRQHVCRLNKSDAFDEMKLNKKITSKYLEYIDEPLNSLVLSELMIAGAPETNCYAFYILRLLAWKHKKTFKAINCFSKFIYNIKKFAIK